MNKNIPLIDERVNLEDALQKNDFVIWKCKGVSMRPFILGEKDLVILEKIDTTPNPYEVVVYRIHEQTESNGDKYVLHRMLRKEGNTYVILGDNCVTLEYVPEDRVIAVMKGIVRDGKELDLDSLKYQFYKQVWVKPWRVRVLLLKVRNKIHTFTNKG